MTDYQPYQPPQASVALPQNPAGLRVGGGFWRRLAAYLIDGFVVGAGTFVLALLLHIVGGGLLDSLVSVASFLLAIAYFPFMESSDWQATLGKRAMGMHVVDDEGQGLSLAHAIGRYLAAALNWLTLGIGYIIVGTRDDKRGLHDLIAHTQVILDDPNHPETPTLAWVIIGLYAAMTVGAMFLAVLLAMSFAGAMH